MVYVFSKVFHFSTSFPQYDFLKVGTVLLYWQKSLYDCARARTAVVSFHSDFSWNDDRDWAEKFRKRTFSHSERAILATQQAWKARIPEFINLQHKQPASLVCRYTKIAIALSDNVIQPKNKQLIPSCSETRQKKKIKRHTSPLQENGKHGSWHAIDISFYSIFS